MESRILLPVFVLLINYTYLFLYQVIFSYRGKICQTNSSKHAVISMQVYFCHIKNNVCKLPYGDQLQISIGQGIYFLLNVRIQYTKKCSDKLFLFCKYVYFMCMGSPEKLPTWGIPKGFTWFKYKNVNVFQGMRYLICTVK